MLRSLTALICIQLLYSVVDSPRALLTASNTESVNLYFAIRDSLSHNSIPAVKVTIGNLEKSFKTNRSGFYVLLPPATYTFILEADGYEQLRRSITVTSDDQKFIFELVNLADRDAIKKKSDTLNHYLQLFDNTVKKRNLVEAEQVLNKLEELGCVESVLEDSQKLSDAYYYYKLLVATDSLNEKARLRIERVDEKIKEKEKGKSTPATPSSKSVMTPEAIDKLYNEGVSKYFAEDYKAALELFKKILKYKSDHEGAKKYLTRTEARLKLLGN
jgi:tetratricopeptide (TPR) repeat protein